MNFRKKIRITNRITINLTPSEITVTVGIIKGISINIGRKGIYLNTSFPGTGIYDRRKIIDIKAEEIDSK